MAEYNKKWADLFPATIGNQTRPSAGVDNTLQYETDKFPQHIANDPVRYDKMNAVVSQAMSNDERLNEKINKTNGDLAAHNKDPKAHATGISGNAATATKLQTPRTLSLTGKAAGSATFDGAANAAINVTSVNADTASKLATARKINITGNATGSAPFDGTSDINIRTTVNESKHAAAADSATTATKVNATAPNGGTADLVFGTMAVNDYARVRVGGSDDNGWLEIATADVGTEPIYVRQYSGPYDWPNGRPGTVKNEVALLDGSGNTKFPHNVTATNFVGHLAGTADNADTVDGIHAASLFYNKGNWDANNWATIGAYQTNGTPPSGDWYGWGQVISSSTSSTRFQLYASDNYDSDGRLHYRTGWEDRKNRWNTILDSENYNLFAPTKTGGGASGTWGINISGNAASATTANTATNASHASNANSATKIVNNGNRNNIANGAKPPSGLSVYQCYGNTGYPQQYGNVVSIGGTGDNELFLSWFNDSRLLYRAKRDQDTNWTNWRAIAFTDEINNYAPTKTGGGASGTWGINISGNAASATNADKLDGYHASDLFRHLGGNQTPVITDIFDRAGTIDMTTMSAADKATHKANINKAANAVQNCWNTDTGIKGYGGDFDIQNGYIRGTLKLTQSYKNFDKILVVGAEDHAGYTYYKLWDVWELANAFANNDCFMLITNTGNYWMLVGTAKHGNVARKLSTDTIWSCQQQNSAIVAIYGIKY